MLMLLVYSNTILEVFGTFILLYASIKMWSGMREIRGGGGWGGVSKIIFTPICCLIFYIMFY